MPSKLVTSFTFFRMPSRTSTRVSLRWSATAAAAVVVAATVEAVAVVVAVEVAAVGLAVTTLLSVVPVAGRCCLP